MPLFYRLQKNADPSVIICVYVRELIAESVPEGDIFVKTHFFLTVFLKKKKCNPKRHPIVAPCFRLSSDIAYAKPEMAGFHLQYFKNTLRE